VVVAAVKFCSGTEDECVCAIKLYDPMSRIEGDDGTATFAESLLHTCASFESMLRMRFIPIPIPIRQILFMLASAAVVCFRG
jgi:hypothetical protein